MSVIVTGMDIPTNCSDCPIEYDMINCSVTDTRLDWSNMDKKRLQDCPLKSVDGLVKEIKDWQTDIHDNENDANKYDFVFEF